MIPQKSLVIPAYTRRTVRRNLCLFGEADGALSARALHFRPRGERLVRAESAEPVAEGVSPLLLTAGGHGGGLFSYGQGALKSLKDGTAYALSDEPRRLLRFLDRDGVTDGYFALTDGALYELKNGAANAVNGAAGGVCACVHYERIFTASGCRVHYSAPLAPSDWARTVQNAGYVDLPSDGGDVLALLSYKDKLYLFRKRGITQLRALGDTLNLKATAMPFSCDELTEGSVQNCGERVIFFTSSGLFSFNGATCVRYDGCGDSMIDRSAPVSSATYDGKYYCTARVGGERCVYCFDPQVKKGYFIRAAADCVAGGDGLYYTADGTLYRLTETGRIRPQAEVVTEKSMLGLSDGNKFFDAVAVEGRGYFTVEARSREGVRLLHGRAGERLTPATPLRGNAFSFVLRSFSDDAEIASLVLQVREEDVSW